MNDAHTTNLSQPVVTSQVSITDLRETQPIFLKCQYTQLLNTCVDIGWSFCNKDLFSPLASSRFNKSGSGCSRSWQVYFHCNCTCNHWTATTFAEVSTSDMSVWQLSTLSVTSATASGSPSPSIMLRSPDVHPHFSAVSNIISLWLPF